MKTIVSTHFNLVNDPSDRRFKENMMDWSWFEYRRDIFYRYTYQSLENQTDMDFERWLIMAEKVDPVIRERVANDFGLYNFLFEPHLDCWYSHTHGNEYDIFEGKNEPCFSLVQRFNSKRHGIDDDWILIIAVSTDDMIRENVIKEMKSVEPEEGRLVQYEGGYFYGHDNGKLVEQDSPGSEVYGRFYPADVFNSIEDFSNYSKEHNFFQPVPKLCKKDNRVVLDGKGFCQVIHDRNDSTAWDKGASQARMGREIKGNEKEEILKEFGIANVNP